METPDPRDVRIAELEGEVATLRAVVAAQAAEIAELKDLVRKLTARLGQNSLNSSLPPSRDTKEARESRPRRAKSRRKRGGQKGHKRAKRELLPPEQVDEFVHHRPKSCGSCGKRLRGRDPNPTRRQIIELPVLKARVIEHLLHELTCDCGAVTCAELPPELRHGDFGPRLCAAVSMLSGGFRMSKRNVQELLSDMFGIDVALGSVSKMESRTSVELAGPHDQVRQRVRASSFVNMDETPWWEGNRKAQLWVASTKDVAFFCIAPERSARIVKDILGEDFDGIVGSDRAKAYLSIDPVSRQACWFHLGRNFQAKVELGGEAAVFGKQMRAFERRLWRAVHAYEADTIDQVSFDRRIKMLRNEVHRTLEQWVDGPDGIDGMCKDLLAIEPALWNFAAHDDVEPSNNRAERDLRHPVVWRRSSFGTDSPRGSRFAERILTVVATCRKQGRSAFQFLADLLTAVWHGQPQQAPQLLPDSS